MRWEGDQGEEHKTRNAAVARAGIFSSSALAPPSHGRYRLHLRYDRGDEVAEWGPVEIRVGDAAPIPHAAEAEGEIPFLKESQWQIPFRVEAAAERSVVRSLAVPAMVHPAPGAQHLVASPTDGILLWADPPPVPGRSVRRGDRLALLIPSGAEEHWSSLRAELDAARSGLHLAERELERVEALVAQSLLPTPRLDLARAARDVAEAELRAATGRVDALDGRRSGTVTLRSPTDGHVVHRSYSHGEAVERGAPLLSIATGGELLISGSVHNRELTSLEQLAGLWVQRADWSRPRDLLAADAELLNERLIFDPHTLAAEVAVRVDHELGLHPGDLVELRVGIGSTDAVVAVPRDAVVEVNARPYVFVQKTGESFTRRAVTLGPADVSHQAITAGIAAGEMVVALGGFDVHIASLSGQLESHRH
jgi:RND family efflux transporter MFP subunit